MKKTAIYLVVSILITLILSYTSHGRIIDLVVFSNSFFIVGIVLLIVTCFSRLISWSIHKRFTLDKLQATKEDIEKAKNKLKSSSKYTAVFGSIYLLISLVLATI